MSKQVEFFVLTFTSKDKDDKNIYSGNFRNFFEKVEEIFDMEDKSKILYRNIGGKMVTISRFLRDNNNHLLIPFGKLKEGKTFTKEDDIFKELSTELFEVSSMVFDITNNVAIITKNKMGPNFTLIEEYLNSFIPNNYKHKIRIVPLIENTSLSYKLDNAEYVKNVDIELQVNDTINAYYVDNLKSGKGYINSFVKSSIDKMKSQNIHLVFGFRYGKKKDSLDINCVRQVIEDLKINPEIIKQIKATCVSKKGERQIGLLNDKNILVEHSFSIKDNFLPSEYLLHNCDEAFDNEISRYRNQRIAIQAEEIPMSTSLNNLCLAWNPKEYYDD